MALSPGTRLGAYEISEQVGAGGMGEVYRATDSQLKRPVAIKVLPALLAGDADRLMRFQREAEVLAALNHPNIAAIYGLEKTTGVTALVMEFVDGEDLAQRIARGPMPIDEALSIAKQLADALETAHEQGIVHRDLKPQNIKVKADGTVKVLDFGLAKALDQGSGIRDQGPVANSPTMTSPAMTMQGVILGTASYMSPEQAKGRSVDRRADIWAFGVVLYEMLTGRALFAGDSVSEILAAVLKTEPDWPALPNDTPASVRRLLRRCLDKDPRRRLSAIGDARLELDEKDAAFTPATHRPRSTPALWIAIAVAIASMGTTAYFATAERVSAPISFETKTWDDQWITNARFLPDGQTIVYGAALTGTVPSLFTLRAGSFSAQPIGDAATQLLAVSSKGELAVLLNAKPLAHRIFLGTLARMTLDGAPKPWLEDITEADWTPDGNSVAAIHVSNTRWTLEYPQGHVLYETTSGYISDPRMSPDGRAVAFVDHPVLGDDRGAVKIVDLNGIARTIAEFAAVEGMAWSRDGAAIYFAASEGGLEAFHPYAARTSGKPRAHTVVSSAGFMLVYDVANDGRMLVTRHDVRVLIRAQLPGEATEHEYPWLDLPFDSEITPDGQSLVFVDQSASAGPGYSLAIRDLRSDRVVRFGEGRNLGVSPNGKFVLSQVAAGGLIVFPIGAGEPIKIARGNIERYVSRPGWLPDSRTIVFCGNERGKAADCYTQEVSAPAPQPLGIHGVTRSLLSEDGRLLLTESADGSFSVTTLGQGTVAVKGLASTDTLLAWSTDHRAVFVDPGRKVPARIDRVELSTGARTLAKEIGPPSRAGVNAILMTSFVNDGRSYTYSYSRELTQLFVASGVGK